MWAKARRGPRLDTEGVQAATLPTWFAGQESWPTGTLEELSLVADVERRFPLLEDRDTGTRVGIGVATGADPVYLTRDTTLVERDRLLPLAMARDPASGEIRWSGVHLVNPWSDGALVSLDDHPLLASYLASKAATIQRQHVARRNPSAGTAPSTGSSQGSSSDRSCCCPSSSPPSTPFSIKAATAPITTCTS